MKKILSLLAFLPFAAMGQTATENYVKTTAYKEPTSNIITTPTAAQASVNVTYFDGLGRPIQQVAHRQSATGKDIVTPIAYDAYGRQQKEYLPYPTSASTMAFDPLATTATGIYYQGQYGPAETNAYSEKLFEASPLNRVLKQAAPGSPWAMGSGKEIKFDYQTNVASEVYIFSATATWNASLGIYDIELAEAGSSSYSANELYKTVTKDENWTSGNANTVQEFKDKEGRVVLKRTFDAGTAHDTYYAYDQYGNLTYVIPPLAEGTTSEAILDGLCYQYRYDSRNRLVEKKLPGKQWEYIVYDALDRVVATGPAYSPFSDFSGIGWMLTKYDAFNRPVITGWTNVESISSSSRKNLQDEQPIEGDISMGGPSISESRSAGGSTVEGVHFGYTSLTVPNSKYYVLTVSYYDDYEFPNAPTDFSAVEGQPVYYNLSRRPAGLPTGSWTRVLQASTDTAGNTSHTLYDIRANAIRSSTANFMGGYTTVDSSVDFLGKVKFSVTRHKRTGSDIEIYTKDSFTYTDQDRLLTHVHKAGTNGTPQLLAKNEYDEIGQLISKKVGGTDTSTASDYLQKVDYGYNIRGWLKNINNVDNLNGEDLFAFRLSYESPQTAMPLYNGNISESFWRTSNDNVLRKYSYGYDNLNRLKTAYYQKPGSVVFQTNSYNEEAQYDKNGNIVGLQRNGEFDDNIAALGIDVLTYSYAENSNKLVRVMDATNNPRGFDDDSDGIEDAEKDYDYDTNGNMISDENKGITSITYNHLNLPVKIQFGGEKKIEYLYDASGVKLRKTVTDNMEMATDYLGGFQYEDGVLVLFPHAEGYVSVVYSDGFVMPSFNYVFNYIDHLGNVRVSYSKGKRGVSIMEENNYYPFGLKHRNYNMSQLVYEREGQGGVDLIPCSGCSRGYQYKFQGQELQNELGLNTYAYGWRDYDPAIGRFNKIDRFAEKYVDASPYHFTANNPIAFREMAGDSIRTRFYDSEGVRLNSIPKAVQKMFNEEFGITVGYNSKTQMLYYEGDYDSDLSQSESATSSLVAALTDDNTSKNADKHGTIIFGHNLDGIRAGDVDGGQWDRTGGIYRNGVTQIDLADFDSQGQLKNLIYSKNLNPRAFNLARIFEHEYLGHQRLFIGGFGDGDIYTMGKVVQSVNLYARQRELPELLNYGGNIVFFGNTEAYRSTGEQKRAVKAMVNGTLSNNLFVKTKN